MTASVNIFAGDTALRTWNPVLFWLIFIYTYGWDICHNTDLRSVCFCWYDTYIVYPARYNTLLQDMSDDRLSILSAPPRSVSLCDMMNFTVILIPGSQLWYRNSRACWTRRRWIFPNTYDGFAGHSIDWYARSA
jgi:hypothetical protein